MRDSRAIRPVHAGRVQATKEHNDAVLDPIDHRRALAVAMIGGGTGMGRRRLEQGGVTQIRSYIRQLADMVVEAVGRIACVDTNHPTLLADHSCLSAPSALCCIAWPRSP